jgi:hypothetical protein
MTNLIRYVNKNERVAYSPVWKILKPILVKIIEPDPQTAVQLAYTGSNFPTNKNHVREESGQPLLGKHPANYD